MNKAITTTLLIALLLPVVSKVAVVAYFNLNKTYIAKTLCENKSNPKNNCKGKCYLTKKLNTQNEKLNFVFNSKTEIIGVLCFLKIELKQMLPCKQSLNNFRKNLNYSFDFQNSLLKPPTIYFVG
ncbi:MAG: hypothetical protein NZ529_01550 [Cytophagaceae bacterium]|nr:hypothetical protein [Cytophagaceae bacterium]MDW8455451.1 hypothetical protein [Cytophagaceae bacterium]